MQDNKAQELSTIASPKFTKTMAAAVAACALTLIGISAAKCGYVFTPTDAGQEQTDASTVIDAGTQTDAGEKAVDAGVANAG